MSNAFMPTLRRRLSDPFSPNNTGDDLYGGENEEILSANPGGAFSPNIQKGPTDAAGHYESNRSRSNSPYAPTLLHEGEVAGSGAPSATSAPNPYAARLADLGGQLQSAYQAPHAGAFRQVLGALLSRKNPALGGIVSGETQRQRKIEPLQEEYGLVSDIISKNRAQQTTDITNRMHNAQADYLEQKPDLAAQPKKTPEELDIENLMGQTNPATQKPYTYHEARGAAAQGIQDTKPDKAPKAPSEEDKAISDYLGSKKLPDTPQNRDRARSVLKTRDRAAKDPELADISKQLKKAQLEKAMEATPDEQRRADLAGNLEENLNNLEEIAKRRPELFGPVAGRATGFKQAVGWNDADVAALKVIEEQTGLAMVGAHAMRNAQHAEKAAQSITGANHTPADALLAPNGPIARARQSLATFKSDAGRRRAAITGEGATPPPASSGGYSRPKPNVVIEQ